jgi:hypothetical protein
MNINPDAVRWVCSACGARTRYNRRTGLSYSHSIPERSTVCAAGSAKLVAAPDVDGPAPTMQLTIPKRSGPALTYPISSERSESVRTVSGGIPGSKRH